MKKVSIFFTCICMCLLAVIIIGSKPISAESKKTSIVAEGVMEHKSRYDGEYNECYPDNYFIINAESNSILFEYEFSGDYIESKTYIEIEPIKKDLAKRIIAGTYDVYDYEGSDDYIQYENKDNAIIFAPGYYICYFGTNYSVKENKDRSGETLKTVLNYSISPYDQKFYGGDWYDDEYIPDTTTCTKPEFTLKKINGGTGVKITIEKTENAIGYFIYLTNISNSYSKYMSNNGKNVVEVADLKKDGSQKRTYTIKGLPKGTYSFQVVAYDKYFAPREASDLGICSAAESDIKSIKIKTAKNVNTKEKTYNFSKTKVGDTIKFGSYEQDGDMTNGKEDIEWIVLSKTKTQMLVVSKYILDALPYNTKNTSTTWVNSSLRSWLNKSFYKTAFTSKEQKLIKKTKIKNPDGRPDGGTSKDNIFLLSLEDLTNPKYGLKTDKWEEDTKRISYATEYATMMGSDNFYWLRTQGKDTEFEDGSENNAWRAKYVTSSGTISECDINGYSSDWSYFTLFDIPCGVRPAIYISLK